MRINDANLTASLGSNKAVAGATRGSESAGKSAAADLDRDQESDNVSLSNLSSRLSEFGASSRSRDKQIDELSSLFAGGGYSVNAAATSQGMIRDAGLSAF